jgi:hypothetical protein
MPNQSSHARVLGTFVRVNPLYLWLFCLGAYINAASYLSFEPVLAAVIFFGIFYGLLHLPFVGGAFERYIFSRVFAIGFLMAGIAAFYANQLLDQSQLFFSDAGGFFADASASERRDLSLLQLQALTEGGLAIKLWAAAYDFFAELGFARERYIGILVNVSAVALTGVVTLKMTRLIYGFDPSRFERLTLIFSLCGLFWLFASIHMRDSVLLLAVTVLTYLWLYFLKTPDMGFRLALVIAGNLLAATFLGFLRAEFVFVPIAMAMSATAALILGSKQRKKFGIYLLGVVGIGVIGWSAMNFYDAIQELLLRGSQEYSELATTQQDGYSLGMALIVNQPMPIRAALGSIYLLVFPIPFWTGFQLQTAYALFKSFNVIFFYFFIPLLVLSFVKLWKDSAARSPAILFLAFVALGFTVAIACTSLETRHFGVFLPSMFVLAVLPDLRVSSVRINYLKFLMVVLGGVAFVHLAWGILKL